MLIHQRNVQVMATRSLDELDKKILRMVSGNARVPYLEVARECGVSGAAIHQRIQRLTKLKIIKGSEFIFDPNALGFETCAYVGVFLREASKFDEVIKRLKTIPEIVECHFTTGKYAIFLKLYAKNNKHLLNVIHDELQNINGIASTETIISLSENYRKQLPIE